MKKTLEVGISLPIETVTQRIGIIGQTGMGKTHLTTVLAEEMLEIGTPLVCLDPQGGMHVSQQNPNTRTFNRFKRLSSSQPRPL